MTYRPIIACLVLATAILPPELLVGLLPMLFMPPLFTSSPCPSYCSDPGPTATSLTVSGIANLNCATCTAFNTTMIIPSPYPVVSGDCVQQISSGTGAVPTDCEGAGSNSLTVKFQPDGSGNTQVRAILEIGHGTLNATFHQYILVMDPSPMACNGITKTVPFSSTTPGFTQLCDASASSIALVN